MHNIPEEKFDFNAYSEKIEVKTTSNFERVHVFTAEQSNPTMDSVYTIQVSNGMKYSTC